MAPRTQVIVVLGSTGDMATRKIYPALFRMSMAQVLDLENTYFIGVTRGKEGQVKDDESFRNFIDPFLGPGQRQSFLKRCIQLTGDCSDKQYMEITLQKTIDSLQGNGGAVDKLIYFSIPWQVFSKTIEAIPETKTAGDTTKIVIEKPIGRDLESCDQLVSALYSKFGKENIFFLDHFLGKEMVQNIAVIRYYNSLLSPVWNKDSVTAIRISCREVIFPEGSVYSYFEDHGIIRDIIIDHLLPILTLITMEPPEKMDLKHLSQSRLELLKNIRVAEIQNAVLGRCSAYSGKQLTFAEVILYIDTPRWEGVPIILKAGKGLYEKRTDIRLHLKEPRFTTKETKPNEIVFRVDPNEDVYLKVMRKVPGAEDKLVETKLDFLSGTASSFNTNSYKLGSYERLLSDVLKNDRTFFADEAELREKWRVFGPLLEEIDLESSDIRHYEAGTRGPKEADDLANTVGFFETAKLTSELIAVTPKTVLDDLLKEFRVDMEEMKDIVRKFVREMKAGLEGKKSSLKMLPSYVTTLPQGTEKGIFYALDIGGTNFRVTRFNLDGKGNAHLTDERKFTIPEEVMVATEASALHDFMADCIVNVPGEAGEDRKYGYTFSFPVEQKAIDSGVLLNWTKGFKTKGVEGKDVVPPLREALKSRGFAGEITALVNDTVGTLASGAFKDPNCVIGVILGTGTNAAYIENVENIRTLPEGLRKKGGEMVINIEWGAFGDGSKSLPSCRIDEVLDANSRNPGKQSLEKKISGFYLGEITRLCLKELIEAKEIYADATIPDKLTNTAYSFESRYLSDIEYDLSEDFNTIQRVESQVGIENSTLNDRRKLKEVCGMVIERAARLTAIAIAGTTIQSSRDAAKVTVGVDGSVYEHHPSFRQRLKSALRSLGVDCNIILSKDGSGKGAALIACGVEKQRQAASL